MDKRKAIYKISDYKNAYRIAKELRRRGAENVYLERKELFTYVIFIANDDLINTGRHGSKYTPKELAFIVNYYLAGYPPTYIAIKVKRTVSAVLYKLKSFGLYVYDKDNSKAITFLRILGQLAGGWEGYKDYELSYPQHTYSIARANAKAQGIDMSEFKEFIIEDRIAAFRCDIKGRYVWMAAEYLRLKNEEILKLFDDPGALPYYYNLFLDKCFIDISARCDLFSSGLLSDYCSKIKRIPRLTNTFHSVLRHQCSGDSLSEDFPVLDYIESFSGLQIDMDLSYARQSAENRMKWLAIRNIINFCYNKIDLQVNLINYLESINYNPEALHELIGSTNKSDLIDRLKSGRYNFLCYFNYNNLDRGYFERQLCKVFSCKDSIARKVQSICSEYLSEVILFPSR